MKSLNHKTDLCIVGGGLAGMAAAIAAARQGCEVILMQDRPVLGGNASSEIRMWVCGAHGENMRETGIIEELQLENLYRNPQHNLTIWDSVLYGAVKYQDNLTVLLNCSCLKAEMKGTRINSITGWQLTTETTHIVEARQFADCSGDGILAELSGANYRIGHEAREEFSESIAPEQADKETMGMSCLIQARETDKPVEYIPPAWAHTYTDDDQLNNRSHSLQGSQNFWWIEIGGQDDSIHDTEILRDELLRISFGIWDHIKNHGDHEADNWDLEWIGFLPGKRESRRIMGDYILTQNDVREEGRFDDLVAYGGWTMDDHHPAGLRHPGKPTIFHEAPSPYGIPYRCLYSRNIDNLFFAGRNISTTHAALSSTRVMATCSLLGQAVGSAAALAIHNQIDPRGVYTNHIKELQQQLMQDDCYLPWQTRAINPLTAEAALSASQGEPEALRSGIDRPVGENLNAWEAACGDWAEYAFDKPAEIKSLRLVFDSDLNRPNKNIVSLYKKNHEQIAPPAALVKDFRIETAGPEGEFKTTAHIKGNYQRLVQVPLDVNAYKVRVIPESTWGSDIARCFAMDILGLK